MAVTLQRQTSANCQTFPNDSNARFRSRTLSKSRTKIPISLELTIQSAHEAAKVAKADYVHNGERCG